MAVQRVSAVVLMSQPGSQRRRCSFPPSPISRRTTYQCGARGSLRGVLRGGGGRGETTHPPSGTLASHPVARNRPRRAIPPTFCRDTPPPPRRRGALPTTADVAFRGLHDVEATDMPTPSHWLPAGRALRYELIVGAPSSAPFAVERRPRNGEQSHWRTDSNSNPRVPLSTGFSAGRPF